MNQGIFIGTHKEEEKRLKVHSLGEGRYEVDVEGVVHQVDARRFGGGNWSLIIDGQSYDVELEVAGPNESEGAYNSLVRGRVVRLRMRDERRVRMAMTTKKFALTGPQTLTSPMPGKVVKILVAVGREVEEGQPLVIVEAMKMENELRSPKTGRVSAVMVAEGQGVEAGTKLVAVE
jgi:biotin carboxyl carrier protein